MLSDKRALKATIYSLKRQFPTSIVLKITGEAYFDLDATGSGDILNPSYSVTVDRAIALPKSTKFISLPGLAIPGTVNISMRQILVDVADLDPALELKQERLKVVFEDKEWDIKALDLVSGVAYQLFLQEVEGSTNDNS